MANSEHIELLHAGVRSWNLWRRDHPQVRPDFAGADLNMIQIPGADLSEADLSDTCLWDANLNQANLSGANLRAASLIGAYIMVADLRNADLSCADLRSAYLRISDLHGANLTNTILTAEDQGGQVMGSFFDLATCYGLESAVFGDPAFLPDYLARAFEYAHRDDTPYATVWPKYVAAARRRLAAYRNILHSTPTPEITDLTRELSAELIKYLARHPAAIHDIRPRLFEELIAEILASYGWEVNLTPSTRDGGYDLFAISRDKAGVRTSWIVECKRYRLDRKVGIDIVRALYATKLTLNVANMLLATTSHFTKGVQDFKASRYDLELRDYEGILDWLNIYQPRSTGLLHLSDGQLIIPGESDS